MRIIHTKNYQTYQNAVLVQKLYPKICPQTNLLNTYDCHYIYYFYFINLHTLINRLYMLLFRWIPQVLCANFRRIFFEFQPLLVWREWLYMLIFPLFVGFSPSYSVALTYAVFKIFSAQTSFIMAINSNILLCAFQQAFLASFVCLQFKTIFSS